MPAQREDNPGPTEIARSVDRRIEVHAVMTVFTRLPTRYSMAPLPRAQDSLALSCRSFHLGRPAYELALQAATRRMAAEREGIRRAARCSRSPLPQRSAGITTRRVPRAAQARLE
jgi:hypothetical protein